MEFFGKDDRELIEAVNTALGMKHRSKPYDHKNIDDLIEATKMITGNKTKTAEILDMNLSSLCKKIKQYGLTGDN